MDESPFSGLTDRRFRGLALLLVALAAVVCYANTLRGEFVWDDASSILLHRHVQDPGQFFQLFREDQHAFGRGQGNFYRPLVAASFMMDFALTFDPSADAPPPGRTVPQVKPFVFHLSNIAWHAAAAMLLVLLLGRLGAPRPLQLAVPLIYAVHPLHTEAVAYISGRADMMSAVFMYAALLCALAPGSPMRRSTAAVLSGILFAAGLLSKESTAIYPFLLLLLVVIGPDARTRDAGLKGGLPPLAIAGALLAGYAALRMTVLRFGDGGAAPDAGLGQRIVETGQAFAGYVWLLFVPTNLHMERSLEGAPLWTAAAGALLIALMAGLIVWGLRTGQRRMAAGFGWFLLTWLPISGLFPLNAPMAEHWMYVPMAGFWWGAGELALHLLRGRPAPRRALALAVCAALAIFAAMTAERNRDWHDNARLFRATLAQNPETLRVHYNLAVTYDDLLDNRPGARRHYEAVLERRAAGGFTDDDVDTMLSLGDVLARQDRYEEAMRHYSAVLSLREQEAFDAYVTHAALGLGRCLLALGEIAQADQVFQEALARDPGLAPVVENYLLGAPLEARGG